MGIPSKILSNHFAKFALPSLIIDAAAAWDVRFIAFSSSLVKWLSRALETQGRSTCKGTEEDEYEISDTDESHEEDIDSGNNCTAHLLFNQLQKDKGDDVFFYHAEDAGESEFCEALLECDVIMAPEEARMKRFRSLASSAYYNRNYPQLKYTAHLIEAFLDLDRDMTRFRNCFYFKSASANMGVEIVVDGNKVLEGTEPEKDGNSGDQSGNEALGNEQEPAVPLLALLADLFVTGLFGVPIHANQEVSEICFVEPEAYPVVSRMLALPPHPSLVSKQATPQEELFGNNNCPTAILYNESFDTLLGYPWAKNSLQTEMISVSPPSDVFAVDKHPVIQVINTFKPATLYTTAPWFVIYVYDDQLSTNNIGHLGKLQYQILKLGYASSQPMPELPSPTHGGTGQPSTRTLQNAISDLDWKNVACKATGSGLQSVVSHPVDSFQPVSRHCTGCVIFDFTKWDNSRTVADWNEPLPGKFFLPMTPLVILVNRAIRKLEVPASNVYLEDQYSQVANVLPPLLAKAIAGEISSVQ
ncbi:hypothetical protein DFS33DRAFT_1270214 [Desarmillaria ectypa]|nr:hypothetical protein DFS33DRAFT_1270214 [Desarmillaria ectypa]